MLYLNSYPTDLSIHFFVLFAQRMEFCCFFRGEDIFECNKGTISISKEISEFSNLHIIGNWTIMFLPFVCFGKEEDSFVFVCDNPVLDCMSLLFPRVVFLLNLVFLWTLYFSFTPIEEELFEIGICLDKFLYTSDFSLWENNLSSESLLKEWEIFHYPIMSSPLACSIPKEPHHLECEIESYVRKDEEKLFSP